MTAREAIAWFKSSFRKPIEAATGDTPFTLDMLAAVAYQETGYLWAPLIGRLSVAELLKVCVGDTIDAPGRSAFPTTKAQLLSVMNGREMFEIAREALEAIGRYDRGYQKIAAANPNKFCHGFGIFQYDLQFFRTDPEFFLGRKWYEFSACLTIFLGELRAAMKRAFGPSKGELTDQERVFVAIAYNRGSVNLAKGFKQGHQDEDGRFYGENVLEYLRIAQSIPIVVPPAAIVPPLPGTAPLAAPTPIEQTDDIFMMDLHRAVPLRSEAKIIKAKPATNVVARLPAGQLVHRLSGKKSDLFIEIETSLDGGYLRGFVPTKFVKPVRKATSIPVLIPSATEPAGGIVAVYMPRRAGTVTKRSAPAGALSLNEPGQPERKGETAADRCAELAAIIEWLAVDKPTHARYQGSGGTTFCNIYAHDYCFLAGVYLPRVWWMPGAIERLARGETVEPLYERTIDEQRANDLFRWLRDFGPRFGWRQTGTPTKLQEAADLGGIGLIVARRKLDGKSGHIVAVVPETDRDKARRNASGEVIAPLQSQAGVRNFRYGTGTLDWWKGEQFADSGFWIHA
jgi:hypothetical protein